MTTQKTCYITWVPDPKEFQGQKQPITQFNILSNIIKSCSTCWQKWEFNPELTLQGNLHFHGFYILKDLISYQKRWYAVVLPKLKGIGFVKISEVRHKLDITYCRKSNQLMEAILNLELPLTAWPPKSRVPLQEYHANEFIKIWDEEGGQWVVCLPSQGALPPESLPPPPEKESPSSIRPQAKSEELATRITISEASRILHNPPK